MIGHINTTYRLIVVTKSNYCYKFAPSDDGSIIRDELAPKEEGHEGVCCLYNGKLLLLAYMAGAF